MAAGQTPLNIATLCRMLAVSERGLRNPFHRVHGIPPHRRLRTLMLSQTRRALMSARSPSANVTETAIHFGFLQLGRFSVEYREMFGESPSETLRQSVRERGCSKTPERSVASDQRTIKYDRSST